MVSIEPRGPAGRRRLRKRCALRSRKLDDLGGPLLLLELLEDGQGGLAFVLLVVLVMGVWAALFFMDRVRRRREEQEASQ